MIPKSLLAQSSYATLIRDLAPHTSSAIFATLLGRAYHVVAQQDAG